MRVADLSGSPGSMCQNSAESPGALLHPPWGPCEVQAWCCTSQVKICLHGIAKTKPGAVPHKSNCLHGIAQTSQVQLLAWHCTDQAWCCTSQAPTACMALHRPSLVLYLTSQTACMALHRPLKPNCLHGIAQTKPGAVPHKSNCLHGIAQTKPWPRMLTSSFLLQEWREDCPEDGQDGGLPRLPEGRSLARQPCSGTAPKHWMCCGTQACLHACWQAVYTEKALLILLAKSSGVHQLQKNSPALVVPGWLLVCSRAQNLSHNWCMCPKSFATSQERCT